MSKSRRLPSLSHRARGAKARSLVVCGALLLLAASACSRGGEHGKEDATVKSAATIRAERRLYDGAPPVIPHGAFGIDCGECHNLRGMEVTGVGYAPPTPHALTSGIGATARCRQCHVSAVTGDTFVENRFEGLPQDLRHGRRLHALAPPVIPHPVFMRENCTACHSGRAAREEIRTSHPERERCRQCHVERTTVARFSPSH